MSSAPEPVLRRAEASDASAIGALDIMASLDTAMFLFGDESLAVRASTMLAERDLLEYPLYGSEVVVVHEQIGGLLGLVEGDARSERSMQYLRQLARLPECPIPGPERLRRAKAIGECLMPVVADMLYLARLAVAPALRGRGIGRLLMRRALERLRDSSARALVLDVASTNTQAIALYELVGMSRQDAADREPAERALPLFLRYIVTREDAIRALTPTGSTPSP